MSFTNAAIISFSLFLFAGCSGEKKDPQDFSGPSAPAVSRPAEGATAPLRRDFVIMRELIRQHELQQGNELRKKAVESHLRARFPTLPDDGLTAEELTIRHKAEELLHTLPREE